MKYLLVTESALDVILYRGQFEADGYPVISSERGLVQGQLSNNVSVVATTSEPPEPYSALISTAALQEILAGSPGFAGDVFRRIARVVKSLKAPPIHLPRHWAEFHHKNLLTFFALPKSAAGYRWVVDTNSAIRCARFDKVTSTARQIVLANHVPSSWPDGIESLSGWCEREKIAKGDDPPAESLVQEVDLEVIGSGSVVRGRSFDDWLSQLTDDQKRVMDAPLETSLRIIGPAGAGKTLALCLKAVSVARSEVVKAAAKKILIVTHSWAMAERIDGTIQALCNGDVPAAISVWPLQVVLDSHCGQGRGNAVEIIGDDSRDGRLAAIELIQDVLSQGRIKVRSGASVSQWIASALQTLGDPRVKAGLALSLYDEFTGVLSAEGVVMDDDKSVERYLKAQREEWMPPFPKLGDRRIVLEVYREFLMKLSDLGAITTDQFVADCIRVLETFTWRMRRETDGYDYIFVDELQLFDAQERMALGLLGRGKSGVTFFTAEDPSQGVFSALHGRQVASGVDTRVYLKSVHRFDAAIFRLVDFLYQKFSLNTIPLRIEASKSQQSDTPILHRCVDLKDSLETVAGIVVARQRQLEGQQRICVVVLGDSDDDLSALLCYRGVQVVQLKSFDDIEQLSYRRRSVVVAPWQFIGGAQFSHVVVLVSGSDTASTNFGRLREMTAIYLACSRAAHRLEIVCGSYVPAVLREALGDGLIKDELPAEENA